ncbi:MAG TPA: hypothetical protein PK257_02380 [Candidatus Woesebacteria bacterium]|nr:hypothetical protein [Candidatus Woesebacteria bacterium]
MKRFLIVLLFLIVPLFTPIFVSAQNSTSTSTPTYTCKFEKYNPNIFEIIWEWITSLFEKPYDIDINRGENEKVEDFSDYGNISLSDEYKNKHSYVGSRTTASNTQDCLKGKIINDVFNGKAQDKILGKICSDSNECLEKKISDLALYLTQTNQKFICDENDTKIDTPADLLAQIETKPSIPDYELPCYEGIYNDFFLTPIKDISNDSSDKANTIKIMDQPIPYQNQDQNKTVESQKIKLNNFFSSQLNIDANNANGLEGLRPEGW